MMTHAEKLKKIADGMRKPYVLKEGRFVYSVKPVKSVHVTVDMEDDFIKYNANYDGYFWDELPKILKRHSNPFYRAWRIVMRLCFGPRVRESPAVFGSIAEHARYGGAAPDQA